MKRDGLIEAALTSGAAKAALVSAQDVTLSEEFRSICESNACGMYGQCYMCPPDVGPIAPLMERVRGYRQGLLYQTIHMLTDSFDIEGMEAARNAHAQVSQRLHEALDANTGGCLHLSSGGCGLCEACAKQSNQPCRYPDKALPSMESYGINVYDIACQAGLKYTNGQNTVTYFGLVLFDPREESM